ncbi:MULTISPECIES: PLP-dependent aminotransferase family protein [Arthrobacter]|uniref:PLP-dependent aminotransferase family protein n=2 Tax=Arthrobacter TaxID=1663 RepID=A0ABU9KLT4_9MICC|nr:PLP-dependent aminotransferase family protein [Arthrobacter sp. YJM1]MDP5228439.1 PLP-dependent aminotransferase family protein [Arthrobacter sp. YJM1]
MNNDSTGRIVAALRSWIATAPDGAQLPSSRELVARFNAGPVTVQKALRQLGALGLVESRPGVGTFVRRPRTSKPQDFGWQTLALRTPHGALGLPPVSLHLPTPETIGLHSGYPAVGLLPERLVRTALARAARTEAALAWSPAEGLPELRAWFAGELAAVTAPGLTPPSARDVLVLPGSQSGLSSIFRALVGTGRPLLIESPTYWGALLAAAQAGVRLVPVASGPDGPDPEDLERAFQESGARAFYAQPHYANPTGAQWDAGHAEAILGVVREQGAFLIEDDWAHDFGIETRPRPLAAQDDAGHVVYIRSLTKSVSPSLRVAALVARGPALQRILADRAAETMYVSGVLQAAALDVVTQPAFARHLSGVRGQLAERRDLLLASLAERLPEAYVEHVPRGGLNLWVRLPDGTDVPRLVRDAAVRGVLVADGTGWFPAEPSGAYLRLNFSGPAPERFPEGVGLLAEALRDQA